MGEEFELTEVDPDDFSDSEGSEEEFDEELEKLIDEMMRDTSDAEQGALRRIEQAAPSIRRAGASIANRSAVARASADVPSVSRLPQATLRGLTDAQLRDLTDGLDSLKDAVEDIGRSPGKGPLYTRQKFWAFVVPSMVAVVSALTAIIAVIISAQSRAQDPSGESDPTDTSEISDEMKALLLQRAEEWRYLSIVDLCDRIRDFAVAYTQSILAQLTVIRDLKLLVQDPTQQAALDAFLAQTAPGLAVAVEQAYINTLERPRYLAVYDTIKTMELPGSTPDTTTPISVPQAVIVMELALARIYAMIKAVEVRP